MTTSFPQKIRAVLLFNPKAGPARLDRLHLVEAAAEALRSLGWQAEVEAIRSAESAGEQAAAACERGASVVFACGGDGTVHGVLQGMVGRLETSLGILPMGSANVLARHLRVPLDPVQAARVQATRVGVAAPVGCVHFQGRHGSESRYFAVIAGAGPDGLLMYRMLAAGKQRLGRLAYYLRALRLLVMHRFARFRCAFDGQTLRAVSVMCVRVGDLGGVFSPLVRGGAWDDEDLLVNVVRPPGLVSFTLWWAMANLRLERWNPFVRQVRVKSIACEAAERPVQVQADGEWLGRTPMRLEVVPGAVRLLAP